MSTPKDTPAAAGRGAAPPARASRTEASTGNVRIRFVLMVTTSTGEKCIGHASGWRQRAALYARSAVRFLLRTLSLSYVRRHLAKTLLTLLGVVVGVATFTAIRSARASLITGLRGTIDRMAGKAQLQV